ncbi:hypothetical protein PF006_g15578 [Phytophthora fragariae]|uniref:Uncharacterized protein n=1 Tax=Phytophthora fragariae TaxID=53985 RepID=A0A6A3T7N0_9STRA|nr:hypothetical protein PF003_g35243 [Phytophthora fragariae]KAE8999798.1 hypothetical protein PF011_g14473 [Phytophthora fragariae]KAE9131159.1 hypothetical protein PF006_g15578 [Phytophthora fragariae]
MLDSAGGPASAKLAAEPELDAEGKPGVDRLLDEMPLDKQLDSHGASSELAAYLALGAFLAMEELWRPRLCAMDARFLLRRTETNERQY